MLRPRKLCLAHIPLAVALFFTGCIAYGYLSRALRQTPYHPAAAGMQGLSYSLVLPGGEQVRIRAEKMSVDEQRMGKTVFALFKEIVLSTVRVTIKGGDASNIFDWATFDRLAPLGAFVLPDMLEQDKLYLAGTKIVLRNVEVSVYPRNRRDCGAQMVADSLCLGAISDDAVFTGRFDLKINPSEHVYSTAGAVWYPSEKEIRLPKGFSHKSRPENGGIVALPGGDGGGIKLAGTSTGPQGQALKLGKLQFPDRFGSGNNAPEDRLTKTRKFFKYLRSLKRDRVETFFWQYIALNPDTLPRQRVSPAQILMPNFKQGAFDPGPFFGSTATETASLWQNAVDLGKGWKWLKWLGCFHPNPSHWVYHEKLGWLLPSGTSTESIWFYDPAMDTSWWTSAKVFPYVFRASDGAWLFYEEGSSNPRWFCNLSTRQWERH